MPSAPPSTFSPLSRRAVVWGVFLGNAAGDRPALTDRVDWLRITGIHLGVGDRPDSISLDVITSKAGKRVQDLTVPVGYSRIVEVRQLDASDEWTICVAWGQLSTQTQRLADRTESLTCSVRLDWFLFGGRLTGYRCWDDRGTGTVLTVERDVWFNPSIDGQTEGNRSALLDPDYGCHTFVAADSMRSAVAIALQNQDRESWDLPTAIETTCWLLNPDETFIKNPSVFDLQAVITDTAKRLLKNIRIPLGTTLPAALDLLCEPMGYRWYTETIVDTTDPALPVTETVLRVFKNGVGVISDLKAQRVGEAKRSDETNIADYSATLEIATPNVVRGRGSLVQREGTFQLVPGWAKALDSVALWQINWQRDAGSSSSTTENRHVGRLWVLNEAGDHGAKRVGIEPFTDLSDLFEEDVTRLVRRQFLPCLTKTRTESDKQQRGAGGVYLEWNDGTSAAFRPYTGAYSILEHECGVMLEGEISEEFWSAFVTKAGLVGSGGTLAPHLRVTACINSDSRLTHTAERRDVAPNGRDIPLHIDASDRFHDRLVRRAGPFTSRWTGNHFEISAFDVGLVNKFVVASEIADRLPKGASFVVIGGTDNDGRYTVEQAVESAGNTTITPLEEITNTTDVEGTIAIDTEEAADLPALKKFAEEARDVHDGAKVAVSASLKGHDWHEYKRGNLVSAVQPRNLSLNNYHDAQPLSRHPQIVGINYLFSEDSQRTELVLEVPDAERPELEIGR